MRRGNVTGKLSFICRVEKDLGNSKYTVRVDPENMKGFPSINAAGRAVYFEKVQPQIGNYYVVWSAELDENRNVFATAITEVQSPNTVQEVSVAAPAVVEVPVVRQENPQYRQEDVLDVSIPASNLVPKFIQC